MSVDEQTAIAADATTDLVATKIDPPPPRAGLFPRSRLLTELGDPSTGRLTLLSAPAGWGKTTLLAEWSTSIGPTTGFAWVGLDANDNDPGQFWSYVVEALRLARPGNTAIAPGLSRLPRAAPAGDVIPALINHFRGLSETTVLILDDYHQITTSAIHDAVSYLIKHSPPSLHIVISSRSDPPLLLGRLRAAGQLTEIRAAHLRFDEAEARLLLEKTLSLDLESETVRLLWERTEGWPAGLYLAGLSIRDHPDPNGFATGFAGDDRNIAEYLTEEILDSQPEQLRGFLLRTSILDRLTASLCDAVNGESGSQAVLQDLERANLFVIPLDGEGQWFRYHRLFGDWLRHELAIREPDIVADLHLRAARWHRQHRSYPLATDHALSGDDVALAADLIEEFFYLADYGDRATTSRLAAIPDEIAVERPRLALARAVDEIANGHVRDAGPWLEAAEQHSESIAGGVAEAELLIARGTYYRFLGDIGRAVAATRRAVSVATYISAEAHTVALGLLASVTFWESGPAAALPPIREYLRRIVRFGISDRSGTAVLALMLAELGDLAEARDAARQAFETAKEIPGHPLSSAAGRFALGWLEADDGDAAEAREQVTRGIAIAESQSEPLLSAYGRLMLADMAQDDARAREHLRAARRLIEDLPDPGRLADWVARQEQRLSRKRPIRTENMRYVEELTEREHQVLRCLSGALSQREIARELYISHNTVKGYVKNIYRKLGVSSRQDALAVARELNLF